MLLLCLLFSRAAAFHHPSPRPRYRPWLYNHRWAQRSSFPAASAVSLDTLLKAVPFLGDTMLSDDVEYNGLGLRVCGRALYSNATMRWREVLPQRLQNFDCTDKVVLPPDSRGIIACRYKLSFDARVPPAVLPGQRRRLDAARLQRTADGRTRVTALIAGTLHLDEQSGLVSRHNEELVGDPMAVTTSIAHFELLNARAVALTPARDLPPLVREPVAYWSALRGMMRIELEEIRRRERAQSDELSVLTDDYGVSDEDFERAFRGYIARIFLIGAFGPLAVFIGVKLLRAAIDNM